MSCLIETFLKIRGPSLSSEITEHLVSSLNITPAAARKRVSRVSGDVKRLGYVTFPRKARFMYLQKQFGSPEYWGRLVDALLRTKSAYGLAIAALRQRGGFMPAMHFQIACGAPIKQSRHLSPNTIFQRLNEAGLLEMKFIAGLGDCVALVQEADHYHFKAPDVRIRLITEDFLLTAIRDWVRKLGIVSYDKVDTRQQGDLPRVGTFAWDLTAPSYLGFMIKHGKDGVIKPGFVACDICLSTVVTSEGVKPFINKCKTLRNLQNIGACMHIFVADKYSDEAFKLLKQNGIIPATIKNLFGEEVASGFLQLSSVLQKAAYKSINPEAFDDLFKKFGKIEGAAIQLRGTFFEYLVADIIRKTMPAQVSMNRIHKTKDGKIAEADVVVLIEDRSITFIECKGYSPYGEVPDEYMKRWLQHNVPVLYQVVQEHSDWKNLEVRFQFWATGTISTEALAMFEHATATIKKSRYTVELFLGPKILEICKSTKNDSLTIAFKKHFMKHRGVPF